MSRILIAVALVPLFFACGDDAPPPEAAQPSEYRNQAAEFLLKEQAKQEIAKREVLEKEAAVRDADRKRALSAVPEDFPRPFVDLPGIEFVNGFVYPGTVMMALKVGDAAPDGFARVRQAAEADGWTAENVSEGDAQSSGAFVKGAERVDVRFESREGTTFIVLLRLDLEAGNEN